jgi:hypothetical protein
MSRSADPAVPDLPESRPDDRCRIPIRVIAVKIEPVTVIIVPWPETGIPEIIVGWKLGVNSRTGIVAIRFVAGGRIIRIE